MKRVLLDTHALLWFLFDDPRLSDRAAEVMADARVDKLLSVVSLWEITIKEQLGKLSLGMPLETFFSDFVRGRLLGVVAIELPHLLVYHDLPLHHRDPFDRLLIAQARALDVPLLTSDAAFARYEVQTLWS